MTSISSIASADELVSLDDIKHAAEVLSASSSFFRTPLVKNVSRRIGISENVTLHLKLESMQTTGSFKMRGVINQFHHLQSGVGTESSMITMSAGNYGRTFATYCQNLGFTGTVIMPESVPDNRQTAIEALGAKVACFPTDKLEEEIAKRVETLNMTFLHPFDDLHLIAGYGSVGLEILEDCVQAADIVVVPCGGGGLLSGVASAIKLSGHADCTVYGVEPKEARTMYESYSQGRPVNMSVRSIASGLAPPYAGKNTYTICRQFVKDIILVSDEEILTAMFALHRAGLLVEPSGAAAVAAVMLNRIPDATNKTVVALVTGSNVTGEELQKLKSYKSDR